MKNIMNEHNQKGNLNPQVIVSFVFGVIFVVTLLALAIKIKVPTDFQYLVFRIVLSLAAAGVAAMIPGFIQMDINPSVGYAVRAGGALAVFLIVFTLNPASLTGVHGEADNGGNEETGEPAEVEESLSGDEVFERNFGHLDDSIKEKARQHFESLKSIFALEARPLMGDEAATSKEIIDDHFAVYFEGKTHFLKLQTYPLPVGAIQVRAAAVSDDAAPDFLDKNPTWVVIERDGDFQISYHRRDRNGYYWPLSPVYDRSRIYIISEYFSATPLAIDGVMDIWLEIDDLAGKFSSVVVAYGGHEHGGQLKEAYKFRLTRKLRFHPIDTSLLGSIRSPLKKVVDQFSSVMDYLEQSGAFSTRNGKIATELWSELKETDDNLMEAVRIPDVQQDLLLFVTTQTVR